MGRSLAGRYSVLPSGRPGVPVERAPGSGFGLFFVDSMVAEYGGEAWVEDNEPQGATFVVELSVP